MHAWLPRFISLVLQRPPQALPAGRRQIFLFCGSCGGGGESPGAQAGHLYHFEPLTLPTVDGFKLQVLM